MRWEEPGTAWTGVGTVAYLFAAIAVTFVFNVPSNNELAAVASAESATLWARYLDDWTAWNYLRTVGSLLSAACFIQALR